mmetsp:Transcript_4522/g.6805  ORF Transcript_4522/g.6805 Transcript_4522/m.6805 type:complete len:181 (+) Transcript_4522:47-589(+)
MATKRKCEEPQNLIPDPPEWTETNKPNKFESALHYLDELKRSTAPDVYQAFLKVMKDFKSQKISTPEVIAQVHVLLEGNEQLILGFNDFLPPEFRNVEEAPPPTAVGPENTDMDNAREFVYTVKNTFSHEPSVYRQFLSLLHAYQAQGNIEEVYHGVMILFRDHPELMQGFRRFLPKKTD